MRSLPLFAVLLLNLTLTACAQQPAPRPNEIQKGHWRAAFAPVRGVALWYDGVPVTRESSLYLIKPGWTGIVYDPRARSPQITATHTDAVDVLTVQDENADASVGYSLTLGADNSATVTLRYALKHDIPAAMEYGAGYVNAALFAGMPFTADSKVSGTIPFTTPSVDQNKNRFVPSFRAVAIQTRLGALALTTSGDGPEWICFDARRDPQSWALENPIFWLGQNVDRVPYANGKVYTTTARYEMRSLPPAQTPTSPSEGRAGNTVSDAQTPLSAPPIVIPHPKQFTLTQIPFRLNAETRLVIASERDREAAITLQDEARTRYGLTLPIVQGRQSAKNTIALGETGQGKPEGYALQVNSTEAAIAGHDPAGTFYGAQTLCQLFGADAKGVFLWGAQINDYPSLAWRGAHLFVGDQALPFHKKLIGRVFSRLKLNNLVLQCERAKWDTIGKAAPSWAMSKSDLKTEIAYANARYMTVTPLVNSVGHMEWLFSDPARIALAEDPETPYAGNVSNPDTFSFLFRLYDEVLDTFHSPVLHVGGDEVNLRGRYPFRSLAQYPTVADGFVAHVTKVHDYLKSKGVRTMLWGDMLLASGEAPDATNAASPADAARMRAALPKDLLITDWHYAPSGDLGRSPTLFRQSGFGTVIGSTWFTPDNIAGFAKAQERTGQTGLLQTTWAGYESRQENLADLKQFAAFVLAAEYAWNGSAPDPAHLPYAAAPVFRSLYAPKPAAIGVHPGVLLDLGPVANRPLTDTPSGTGWLGYGPAHDLRSVPVGRQRLNGVIYDIAPNAVLLKGALNPPSAVSAPSVTLPLGRPLHSLSLLTATAYAALPDEKVATLTITYADSTRAETPLLYGRDLAAWSDSQDAPNAPVVWHGTTPAGDPIFLRSFVWANPHPEKNVRAVTLTATDAAATPVLFAATGILDKEKAR